MPLLQFVSSVAGTVKWKEAAWATQHIQKFLIWLWVTHWPILCLCNKGLGPKPLFQTQYSGIQVDCFQLLIASYTSATHTLTMYVSICQSAFFVALLLIIISSSLSTFQQGLSSNQVFFIVHWGSTDRCLDIIIEETLSRKDFLAQIQLISLFYIILSGSGGLIWNTLDLCPYRSGSKVEYSHGLVWHDLIVFTV